MVYFNFRFCCLWHIVLAWQSSWPWMWQFLFLLLDFEYSCKYHLSLALVSHYGVFIFKPGKTSPGYFIILFSSSSIVKCNKHKDKRMWNFSLWMLVLGVWFFLFACLWFLTFLKWVYVSLNLCLGLSLTLFQYSKKQDQMGRRKPKFYRIIHK